MFSINIYYNHFTTYSRLRKKGRTVMNVLNDSRVNCIFGYNCTIHRDSRDLLERRWSVVKCCLRSIPCTHIINSTIKAGTLPLGATRCKRRLRCAH